MTVERLQRAGQMPMTLWRTGEPNGAGLPQWQALGPSAPGVTPPLPLSVLRLDTTVTAAPEPWRARYEALERLFAVMPR